MRTDPTDNGGLFIGRRPGTAPTRYSGLPPRGSPTRRAVDRLLGLTVLLAMAVGCMMIWGPLPALAMWLASHISQNAGVWVAVALVLVLLFVFGGLAILRRVDQFWILVRRASGVDQRSGVLARIFVVTACVIVPAFSVWFFLLGGLRPTIAPG